MELAPAIAIFLVLVFVMLVMRKLMAPKHPDDWCDEPETADERDDAVPEEFVDEEDSDDVPANVRMPDRKERMIDLLRTDDRVHADMLRNILIENGIWCAMSGDYNALGLTGTGLAHVTLHVPEGDVFAARELINKANAEAHHLQAEEGRKVCPACGYDLRATPNRCPECGLNFRADEDPTAAG